MPTSPAIVVSTTVSISTMRITELGVAPSALRTPNSFVRSLTAISMMFDTPTTPAASVRPPTIQLIAASQKILRRGGKNTQKDDMEKILMTQIIVMVGSLTY